MSEMRGYESVEVSSAQIEFRESEIVKIRIHLVSWPYEIEEIEECVEAYQEVPNISIR